MENPSKKGNDHKGHEVPKTAAQLAVETKLHDKEVKHTEMVAQREAAAKAKQEDLLEKTEEDTAQKHIHDVIPPVYEQEVQNPHAAL